MVILQPQKYFYTFLDFQSLKIGRIVQSVLVNAQNWQFRNFHPLDSRNRNLFMSMELANKF